MTPRIHVSIPGSFKIGSDATGLVHQIERTRLPRCETQLCVSLAEHKYIVVLRKAVMALTSLSSRAQILSTVSPAAVRPSKRVLQITAKQDMPHTVVSRSGMAAAAAAILLTVRTETHSMQIGRSRLFACAHDLHRENVLFCCRVMSESTLDAGQSGFCPITFPSGTSRRVAISEF